MKIHEISNCRVEQSKGSHFKKYRFRGIQFNNSNSNHRVKGISFFADHRTFLRRLTFSLGHSKRFEEDAIFPTTRVMSYDFSSMTIFQSIDDAGKPDNSRPFVR